MEAEDHTDDNDDLFGDEPAEDEATMLQGWLASKKAEELARASERPDGSEPRPSEGAENEATVEGPVHYLDPDADEDPRAREDLAGFMEHQEEYTEHGQMQLLADQLEQMQKKKFEVRDKIKKFMDNLFDPVIFASISRLIVVEMLSYHQTVFESLASESSLLRLFSCLAPAEFRLLLDVKRIIAANLNQNSQLPFLKVACVLIKELVVLHKNPFAKVIRSGTPQESLKTPLTSFEVVALFHALLFYLGFKPRLVFLVSFDKLNLYEGYKLNMFGIPQHAEAASKKPKDRKKARDSAGDAEEGASEDDGSDLGPEKPNQNKKPKSRKPKRSKKVLKADSEVGSDDDSLYEEAQRAAEATAQKSLTSKTLQSDTVQKMLAYGKSKGLTEASMQKKLAKNKKRQAAAELQVKPEPKKQVEIKEEKPRTEATFLPEEATEHTTALCELLRGVFGDDVFVLDPFTSEFKISKCFLEVYLLGRTAPTIVDLASFNLVQHKEVFLQKLLHMTCTLFVFSIRKARAAPGPAQPEHPERKSSPFFGHKTLLKEVTPVYVNDQWKVLYRRQFVVNRSKYIKLPHITQGITELNKHNPYDLLDEELDLEFREAVEIEDADLKVAPESLFDFTYSRSYVIESKIRPSHALRVGAQPAGKISDRDIYRRRDLIKLYTRIQWKNKCRDIIKGEAPRKLLEIKGWKTLEYFEENQTCELKFELDENGKIPQNEYGNIEVMNGIPPKTVYLDMPGIKFVLRKLDIDWVPAVVEFEFRNGRFVPILKGAVVHERDHKDVLEKYNLRREELEKRELEKESKLMDYLWKDIFKSLYTKKYFKEKGA